MNEMRREGGAAPKAETLIGSTSRNGNLRTLRGDNGLFSLISSI